MMNTLPKLNYVKYVDIDKIRWDNSLSSALNTLVYANSWFLDTVSFKGWDAVISEDYRWLMPLPIKSKLGLNYLATPSFVQQLGVFGPEKPSQKLLELFFSIAFKRLPYVDFNLNWLNDPFSSESMVFTNRTNLVLDCTGPKESIQIRYSDNLRRNILKAEKSNIRFSSCSIRNIINLFQESKGKDLKVATSEWYNIIDQIYNVSALRSKGRCFGAYNEKGELLAGMFIIEWQGRATFLFSGNSEEGKAKGALPALINDYLMRFSQSIKEFDFEGSDDEGLKRFYKSFGSVESNYVHLKINRLPKYLRWLKA